MHLEKLSEYLRNSNDMTLELNIKEIEKIIGDSLPEEAKKYPEWWSNKKDGKISRYWMNSGYIVSDCKNIPLSGKVVFKKSIEKESKKRIIKGVGDAWNKITDPAAESNKRISMFLQLFVTPLIAVIAIVLPILISLYSSENSAIEISEIKFKEGDSSEKVILELTLNNDNPDYDRYIKKAVVHLLDYYEMSYTSSYYPHRLDSDYTYDVLIDGNIVPNDIEIETSQVVPAGGYDKFDIEICAGESGTFLDVIMYLYIELVFDNDDTIHTKNFTLKLGPSEFDERTMKTISFAWRGLYDNLEAICKFNAYDSKYVMDNFTELYNSYYDNRVLIRKYGKMIKEAQMEQDKFKKSPLFLDDFLNYLSNEFGEIIVDKQHIDEGKLYCLGNSNTDEPFIYLLCNESDIIKSIFVLGVYDYYLNP